MLNNYIFKTGTNIGRTLEGTNDNYYKYYKTHNKSFEGMSKHISNATYSDTVEKAKVDVLGFIFSPILDFIILSVLGVILTSLTDAMYGTLGRKATIPFGVIFITTLVVCSLYPSFITLRELIFDFKYLKYLRLNYSSQIMITVRTNAKQENTFLKYLETGLGMNILGLIILQISYILDKNNNNIAGIFILVGLVVTALSLFRDAIPSIIGSILVFILGSYSMVQLETGFDEKSWMVFLMVLITSGPFIRGFLYMYLDKLKKELVIVKQKSINKNKRKK